MAGDNTYLCTSLVGPSHRHGGWSECKSEMCEAKVAGTVEVRKCW